MTDRLGLSSSLLLGNPIPAEYHAVGEELQRAVDQAVVESVENGMARSGKQVTPWLLQRVAELSEGRSLASSESLDYSCKRLSTLLTRLTLLYRQSADQEQCPGWRRGRDRTRSALERGQRLLLLLNPIAVWTDSVQRRLSSFYALAPSC